jgi:hypothetical protein
METKKTIYSVFSGVFYEILEKDIKLLDIGQLPLTKKPSNSCKKCLGRGNCGREQKTFAYAICNCVRKNIDFEYIKSLKTNISK